MGSLPRSITLPERAGHVSALKAKGSTYKWRQLRPLILNRDGYTCRIKTQGKCTGIATHVDHIHGKTQCAGCDADLPEHLQAACRSCNLHKGKPMKVLKALSADKFR